MLITNHKRETWKVPEELSAAEAAALIDAGDAIEVTALRVWHDCQLRTEEVIITTRAGTVLRVPQDITEDNAKLLIQHFECVEPAAEPEKFRPFLERQLKRSADEEESKGQADRG